MGLRITLAYLYSAMTTRLFFSLLVTTIALPVAVEAQTYDLKRGSLVRVRTQGGSLLEGHVDKTSDGSFTLRDESGSPTQIEWSQVEGVERYAQNPKNEFIGMGLGFVGGALGGGALFYMLFFGDGGFIGPGGMAIVGSVLGIFVGIPVGGSIGARQGQRWVDVPPGTTGRGVGLKIRF